MSESKQIADHEDALKRYFDEMLVDDNLTSKVESKLNNVKFIKQYNQNISFQALLFDINGLQLALRTEYVKAILPWPETLLKQDQETTDNKAIMGSYNQIMVINTAYIVLPTQYRRRLATPSFMVVIGHGKWALSCHKINSVITLLPEDIHWRQNMETRVWLAGTAIKKNCSIIDPMGLVSSLKCKVLA